MGSNRKMAIEKLKLTTMFIYKTWSNPQLKTIKRAMNSDQSDHRHNTKI